jgi:nitrate reductase gamma subunit
VTFFVYFLHLIAIWFLIAYLPFTKLAHLVYRTVAMTYAEYAGRKFKKRPPLPLAGRFFIAQIKRRPYTAGAF